MNAAVLANFEVVKAIFDYLLCTATQEEKCRMRFHTNPGDCSPLIQVIDGNTFAVLDDLHPHATWVISDELRHSYSRPRFIHAYNLITGETTDEDTKQVS